jgi:hypothetical protein
VQVIKGSLRVPSEHRGQVRRSLKLRIRMLYSGKFSIGIHKPIFLSAELPRIVVKSPVVGVLFDAFKHGFFLFFFYSFSLLV